VSSRGRTETRIARGDLSEEIGRLKREPGKDLIAYGGATFDQALWRLGLVDEYRLMIQPAALGVFLRSRDLAEVVTAERFLPVGQEHAHLSAAVGRVRTACRTPSTDLGRRSRKVRA
jgi:dihydrofolate reductase